VRFTDNGVHFTDADLAALASQHDAELATVAKQLIRALEAAPDERERMRREYAAHRIAVEAAKHLPARAPAGSPDTTLVVTRKQLAAMIKNELHRNNTRWEQIANRLLYSDQATLERFRAAHERQKASRSVPPPG
jgi:hypothetical protein